MNIKKMYLSTMDENAHNLAKSNGLGIELAEFCTAWNLDDQFAETDAKVRLEMACSDRFVLHGPFNELFPCAIDPKAKQLAAMRYRQTIETAQNYGIRKLVFHGGYNPRIYFPCWYTEQSIQFWMDFLPQIPNNMVLCLENVLEEEPGMLADILRGVNSPKLRMCLDVGHANAYSKIPVAQWITSCADVLDHFHVHNNDTTWDTHSALDCGTMDMVSVLSSIDKNCPNATVTLELLQAESSLQWLKGHNLWEE